MLDSLLMFKICLKEEKERKKLQFELPDADNNTYELTGKTP